MVLALLHLDNLEHKVCYPDPLFFPDEADRNELFQTNRNNLRAITDFLAGYIFLNFFLSFPLSAHIFWGLIIFFHLSLLVLYCRRKVWIWHWAYTIGLPILQFLLVRLIKDSYLYALGASLISPIFVLQITGKIPHIVINFFAQLFLIHFQYRFAIEDAFMEMSPLYLTQGFINNASLVLIGTTVTYGLRSKVLEDIHSSLKTSKHQAEEAYSQINQFLQTFSHELRNPLNSLMGNLELSLHEELSPQVHEMIETAKVCAELLLQLINNILDTSKAQLSRLDVNPTPTRVVDFVSGIWRVSRDLIKRKGLNGYLKIDRRLPPLLYLDFYRVNQILLNLINNALKFTDTGLIWIKFAWLPHMPMSEKCFLPRPYDEDGIFEKEHNVRAIFRSTTESDHIIYLESSLDMLKDLYTNPPQHEEKGILKIIVRDTGCGVKKEKEKLLFKKFAQMSEDPSKSELGTGLGLYITKEICETMGGEIRAYSKENIGTTFIICLPTYCPIQPNRTVSLQEVIDRLKLLYLQILIVDDNVFNQDLLSNYTLKIQGTVVANVRNGREGYDKYKDMRSSKKKLNVIFLDIDLPIMDGMTMCKQIREFEATAHMNPVKIVFVSGNYEEQQIKELVDKNGQYRAQTFLKKPISYEAFINALENIAL